MVARSSSSQPIRDPGSFRDPAGGEHPTGDRVLRYLNSRGAADFAEFSNSGLFDALVGDGSLIPTRQIGSSEIPRIEDVDAVTVLEHERIPFISYAYEWPLESLQSAALQYLSTLRTSLDHGFILKDATTFNTQFRGDRPTMIDVSSFERYQPGQPWAGYSQFCRMFLNPLWLQSAAGIPYQQSLRSSIEGITPAELSKVLPFRKKLDDRYSHTSSCKHGWAASWRTTSR